MSSFKLNAHFKANMDTLRRGIESAADAAMEKVVKRAEKDAQSLYRWREPGEYSNVSSGGGTVWTWTTTGLTAESIKGYIVSPRKGGKNLPSLSKPDTKIYREDAESSRVYKTYTHQHKTDASLTGDYSAKDGSVLGVLTMYTTYAKYLQDKEKAGAVWDIPGAGQPITIEVFASFWHTYYAPIVAHDEIEKRLTRLRFKD